MYDVGKAFVYIVYCCEYCLIRFKLFTFPIQMCGGDKPYLHPELMDVEHKKCIDNALELFRNTRKMGGPEFSKPYSEKLQAEIEESFENYRKHNESKNIFSAARTPAVLFTVLVIAYIVSGVFGFIGLESLANLANLVMGLFLVLLISWMYVRYSGDYREFGQHIDKLAVIIWDNVSTFIVCLDTI